MVKTLPHIVVEFGPTKVDYLACCVCASFIKHLIKLENRLSFIEGIFQYIGLFQSSRSPRFYKKITVCTYWLPDPAKVYILNNTYCIRARGVLKV